MNLFSLHIVVQTNLRQNLIHYTIDSTVLLIKFFLSYDFEKSLNPC